MPRGDFIAIDSKSVGYARNALRRQRTIFREFDLSHAGLLLSSRINGEIQALRCASHPLAQAVHKALVMSDTVENVNQTQKETVMLHDSDLGGAARRYSAKRSLHHAKFLCDAHQAKQVSLVGDFNKWDPQATPLARQLDGCWTAGVELTHGYHEYLFLVEGKPTLDPNATGKTRNLPDETVSLLAVS